jgi:CheY-like chemotaxis protein
MPPEPDDLLSFAPEPSATVSVTAAPWKVLVVDDDEEVHRVTRLATRVLTVLGRPLQLFSAYSGLEAVAVMRREPDVALILMDVVMESEHAGLEAAQAIRHELGNRLVQIVVRTGQPGRASGLEWVRGFGINDCREKTDLTTSRLHAVLESRLTRYGEAA